MATGMSASVAVRLLWSCESEKDTLRSTMINNLCLRRFLSTDLNVMLRKENIVNRFFFFSRKQAGQSSKVWLMCARADRPKIEEAGSYRSLILFKSAPLLCTTSCISHSTLELHKLEHRANSAIHVMWYETCLLFNGPDGGEEGGGVRGRGGGEEKSLLLTQHYFYESIRK